MAHYAIGDVHGCCGALQKLLRRIHFHPARDRLWFTGDLVNRGPRSADTVRLVMDLGDAADCVLGNHDFHLLAVTEGAISRQPLDTFDDILSAADGDAITDWLRRRPLAVTNAAADTILVHAGVHRDWSAADVIRHALEVETALRGGGFQTLMHNLYGNDPVQWRENLSGFARLRLIINILTRIRYCNADGTMDFTCKAAPGNGDLGVRNGGGDSGNGDVTPGNGGTGNETGGLVPWFRTPGRRTRDRRVVFGHWASLGLYRGDNVLGIDTGYCWDGALTAVRLDAPGEAVQVKAEP